MARWTLFAVLGVIYILAVLLLEVVIMPLYVYRPLGAMLSEGIRRLAPPGVPGYG